MCYFNNGPVDKILAKKTMMNTNDSLISKTNIACTTTIEEYSPYHRFSYALNAPESKRQYPKRFKVFLDYLDLDLGNSSIEERINKFYYDYIIKKGNKWLENELLKFFRLQNERAERNEISTQTIPNYYKPIKLFCDMNGISIMWKLITKGIKKGQRHGLKIDSCCSVLEQQSNKGFLFNMFLTFGYFLKGIRKVVYLKKEPNLKHILKTSILILITAESACILTSETIGIVFYNYSILLAVPLALLVGALTVVFIEAHKKLNIHSTSCNGCDCDDENDENNNLISLK